MISSFVIEIEATITNIGSIGATMNAMPVDLIGPRGVFAKLDLPKIKLQTSGTKLHVEPQKIAILDHDKFQAFVKSIMLDERTKLSLHNPKAKVSAMFMSTEADFSKTVDMLGMNGPKIEIVKMTPREEKGGAFETSFTISNPSPLEIYIPESTFHFLDEGGNVIAEQHGDFNIPRGESTHELPGKIVGGGAKERLRLVGKDVVKDSWMRKTITYFDANVALAPEMTKVLSSGVE